MYEQIVFALFDDSKLEFYFKWFLQNCVK